MRNLGKNFGEIKKLCLLQKKCQDCYRKFILITKWNGENKVPKKCRIGKISQVSLLSREIFSFCLKGQCHEIFCFWFFSWISFPPAPEYPIRTVSNFFENSRRYSQLKVDHRCRWHRWQMKKIFNQKNFINFVGTPLDSRLLIYIYFCLQVHLKVSAAWY